MCEPGLHGIVGAIAKTREGKASKSPIFLRRFSMLRRLSLLLGLVLLASIPAAAQGLGLGDKVEVFGGFSYMRANLSPSFNSAGWEFAAEYKPASWIGGVADFSGDYGSNTSIQTYLFGPQVHWPARVSPFAHILIGGAHASSFGFGTSGFAVAIGGGIDATVLPAISWRIIQGDYLPAHLFGSTRNNARISTGLVIHF
jgi:hypothetical protein